MLLRCLRPHCARSKVLPEVKPITGANERDILLQKIENKRGCAGQMANKSLNDINLTTAELVKLCGISLRTIQRAAQEGVIKPVNPTAKTHKYNLGDTLHAYIKSLQEKAAGRDKDKGKANLEQKKLIAEIALKESQGDLHKLKTEIAQGRYLTVEEIKYDYDRFLVSFRKFAMSIPQRVGAHISGSIDPVAARTLENDISKDIQTMLRSFVLSAVPDDEKT